MNSRTNWMFIIMTARGTNMNNSEILEIMKQRHSVRRYTAQSIEQEKRLVLNELVSEMNHEADLHIQMIYDEPKCFESFMAHYGNFTGVCNYIALVGKKSPKLAETLGYYGEKLVLEAQKLGLNTCWVALTRGKSKAVVDKGEKLVCLISIGYGKTQGVEHKNKALQELCNYSDDMPDWFIDGMNGVLLAPTAMNQQKFYFELQSDGCVKASCGRGFYTNLDLGIAKYHFEAVTGCLVK